MSAIPLIGAILVIALINVLGGLLPIQMAGDLQLAYWLMSLLAGVLTYATLDRGQHHEL